jgi:hypothetical protein
MLDVAQVFAWTSMFAGYARTESLTDAVKETFDPGKPCAICKVVSLARTASARHAPPLSSPGGDKVILIFERPSVFVAASAKRAWPRVEFARAGARGGEVPVPPPRGSAELASG